MIKFSTVFLLFSILVVNNFSQSTGILVDFDDGDISAWVTEANHDRTFQLSAEDNALKINYTRTAASGDWDNFNYTPPGLIDVSGNPYLSVKIKSSVNTVVTFKPIYENDASDWLQETLVGDDQWRTIGFEMSTVSNMKIKKIYMYLDGGTSQSNSGVVFFDDFKLGDSVKVSETISFLELENAITSANALLSNTTEGSSEGEFLPGSKVALQTAISNAEDFLSTGTEIQDEVDQAVWDLYDACVEYEKQAVTPEIEIADLSATIQTKYLYMNLIDLSERSLLFGMHDATGYGVGWAGDNDRSDVFDVVGDFPAVFSEDLNHIGRNNDVDGFRYRLTNAYEGGSVITFVWHQYDPEGRSFYANEVNNEKIVTSILPGGDNHDFYKNKLYDVAHFLKSFRGEKGESIPVIFRPYHEHTGGWFWWGDGHCTTQEFNELWKFTFEYFHDSLNVHNLIWAISPSNQHITGQQSYYNIYPGDEYIDIFGVDKYFTQSTVSNAEAQNFLNNLRSISQNALDKNKIPAITEIGDESLDLENWFTDVLLDPIKNDELATNFVFAAVWRNANATHHYAPYPGHSSVQDFMNFYNDPYTVFQKDLPDVYSKPEADVTPPVITSLHDDLFLATSTEFFIEVLTDERAYLRYSEQDVPYPQMTKQFDTGEGGYKHSVMLTAEHGESGSIYVAAEDLFGNQMNNTIEINYFVDTTKAPVYWTEAAYPLDEWLLGSAPLGTSGSSNTLLSNVRAAYFRTNIDLTEIPSGLAILVKSQGGAVVYINGYEAGRININEDTDLSYETNPTSDAAINTWVNFDNEALSQLRVGENVISVEIHVNSGNTVETFDAMSINDKNETVFALGSDWSYYDLGDEPPASTIGDITDVAELQSLPIEYKLYNNYPNPFNPATNIKYQLPKADNVKLEIFDVLGRKIKTLVNQYQNPGYYNYEFDASNLSSGIYIYYLVAGDYIESKKMMLLK